MVITCEINATTGIVSSAVRGEDIKEYDKAQKQLKIHGWNIEFSWAGGGSRVAKLNCSYEEGSEELFGRRRMFFVLEDGVLYLKVKPKSIDANFVAGDSSMIFLRKFNIHEVRRGDPNRIISMIANTPEGIPYHYNVAFTDGEIIPRRSGEKVNTTDGQKVQHATWVVVRYDACEGAAGLPYMNIVYSMLDYHKLLDVLSIYDKQKLSQLR